MTTQTQPQAEKQPGSPCFGSARIDRALRILWSKTSNQLNNDELSWFAGFGKTAEQQALDLADALDSFYCHTAEDSNIDDFRDLLMCLSHQAYTVAGMANIGASAADRLIYPEQYAQKPVTTHPRAESRGDEQAPGTSQGTDKAVWKEVKYWADNHLLAAGNRYRLIDNATKEVITEFDAESVNDAEYKAGLFLREAAKRGVAA